MEMEVLLGGEGNREKKSLLKICGIILWMLHMKMPVHNFTDWLVWGGLCTALYGLTISVAFRRRKEWRYLCAKGVEQWKILKKKFGKI